MRETGIFFLFLLSALILGALVTYPVMQTGWIDYPPHRVMGRLTQAFLLLGLWPFLKSMGLNSPQSLGYGIGRQEFMGVLWRGWLLGVAGLVLLILQLMLLDIRVPDPGAEDRLSGLPGKAISVLIGGLLTSLLEETFFRGALYSAIRRNSSALSAIFWSSLLFALLHFMRPHPLPDGVVFDWAGSWEMFQHVFAGVFQWKHVDSMAALFLMGISLAHLREQTGHIGWCMGLHAGWVFVIQLARYLTDGNPESSHSWLVGGFDGVIGWLAAAWIGLVILVSWWLTRRASHP